MDLPRANEWLEPDPSIRLVPCGVCSGHCHQRGRIRAARARAGRQLHAFQSSRDRGRVCHELRREYFVDVGGEIAQLRKRASPGASSTQLVPSSRFRADSPPSWLTSRGSETEPEFRPPEAWDLRRSRLTVIQPFGRPPVQRGIAVSWTNPSRVRTEYLSNHLLFRSNPGTFVVLRTTSLVLHPSLRRDDITSRRFRIRAASLAHRPEGVSSPPPVGWP